MQGPSTRVNTSATETGRVGDEAAGAKNPQQPLRDHQTHPKPRDNQGLQVHPTGAYNVMPQTAGTDGVVDATTDPTTEQVPDLPQQPLPHQQTLPELVSLAPDHQSPIPPAGNDDPPVQAGHVYEAEGSTARSRQIALLDSHADRKESAGSSTSVVGKAGDATTAHVAELASEEDSVDQRRLLRSIFDFCRPEGETSLSRVLGKYASWHDEFGTDDAEATLPQEQSHDQILTGEDTTQEGPSLFKKDDGRLKIGSDPGVRTSSLAAQVPGVEPSSTESNVDGVEVNEHEGTGKQSLLADQKLPRYEGRGRVLALHDKVEEPDRDQKPQEENTAKAYLSVQISEQDASQLRAAVGLPQKSHSPAFRERIRDIAGLWTIKCGLQHPLFSTRNDVLIMAKKFTFLGASSSPDPVLLDDTIQRTDAVIEKLLFAEAEAAPDDAKIIHKATLALRQCQEAIRRDPATALDSWPATKFALDAYLISKITRPRMWSTDSHNQYTTDETAQASQAETGPYDAELGAISDSDDAPSIFSQASLASTASSVGGVGDMITNLASDLLCNDEMVPINLAALRDPIIGSERYRRNVRRLIKTFGQNLKAEAEGSEQMGAARALQTRRISTHAAHELVARSEALLHDKDNASHTQLDKSSSEKGRDDHVEPDEQDALSDASMDSADEVEDAEQSTDENLTRIRESLLASNAYASLKDRLLEFAHQPYQKRISNAVGADAIGEAGKALHSHDIEDLVEELSWVPVTTPGLCQFRVTFRLSLLDRVQGFLEDHLDTKWDWWPMSTRSYPLRGGYCRLQWRSPCGTPHHLDVPQSVKEPLQTAFRTAPAFLDPAPAPSANSVDHINARIQPSLSPLTGFRLNLDRFMSRWTVPKIVYSSVALSSSLQKAHNLPWPAPVAVDPHPATSGHTATAVLHSPRSTGSPQRLTRYIIQAVDPLIPAAKPQYLHLCIDLGDFRFKTIQCDELRDDMDFFRKLKSTYDSTRGPLRRWFSTWQYDHCKFHEFEKVGNQLALPICEGFPKDDDAMY